MDSNYTKEGKFWARGSNKMMDNFTLFLDSSQTVIGVTRLQMPIDLTSAPSLFDSMRVNRIRLLGNPVSETVIEQYGDHEHMIIWGAESADDSVFVALTMRQRAALSSASYFKKGLNQFRQQRGIRN